MLSFNDRLTHRKLRPVNYSLSDTLEKRCQKRFVFLKELLGTIKKIAFKNNVDKVNATVLLI